ncbi:MAG: glycosyltransferase family 2 protein, partial [Gemmatimonadaceae bacterium]
RHVGNDFWELSDPDLFCKMAAGNLIPMTILFRRAEIGATGYFDEDLRYGEDRLFLLRLIKRKGVFGYVNRPLGTWQRHDNNLTSPSNSLKNYFYSDRILGRLVDNRERWHLDSRELECVFAAQRSLAASWVYCASRGGARTTVQLACRLLRERRISFYCFAKALGRYLVSPLRFSQSKHS